MIYLCSIVTVSRDDSVEFKYPPEETIGLKSPLRIFSVEFKIGCLLQNAIIIYDKSPILAEKFRINELMAFPLPICTEIEYLLRASCSDSLEILERNPGISVHASNIAQYDFLCCACNNANCSAVARFHAPMIASCSIRFNADICILMDLSFLQKGQWA